MAAANMLPDYDEDRYRPLFYRKIPGFANMLGEYYEIKMNALLFLRGMMTKKPFMLASNVVGAGALDDIVFRFTTSEDNNHLLFIQMKHKNTAKLNKDSLLNIKGDFALLKYFSSFMDIKQQIEKSENFLFDTPFEDCHFAIFTNAKLVSWKGNLETRNLSWPGDEFIKLNEVRNSFAEQTVQSMYSELKMGEEIVRKISRQRNLPHTEPNISNEEDAKDFLRRIKLLTGQPREDQLDVIIKKELQLYYEIDDEVYIEMLFTLYFNYFKSWWQQSKGVILTENSDVLSNILSQTQMQMLVLKSSGKETEYHIKLLTEAQEKKYNQFSIQQNSRSSLRDAILRNTSGFLHVVVKDGSVDLTSCKVYQTLKSLNTPYHSIVVGLKEVMNVNYQQFPWEDESGDNIVINCDEIAEQEMANNLATKLKKIKRDNQTSVRFVFISKDVSSVKSYLRTAFDCAIFEDSCTWDDLTIETRDYLLRGDVNFQGQQIQLLKVIPDMADDSEGIPIPLQGDSFIQLCNGNLKIGSELENEVDYYIERNVTRGNLDFEVTNIDDRVVLLIADRGMGKTSFITKLAKLVKRSDSALWVVRIDLIECKEYLDKFDFNSNIDETILESFLTDVTTSNHLERYIFQLLLSSGKVVCFIDGYDEVDERHEENVSDLLKIMQQKNMSKIWITSRKDFQDTLETQLNVKAYSLKGFTMNDQKEYLRMIWATKCTEDQLSDAVDKAVKLISEALPRKVSFAPQETVWLSNKFFEKYWQNGNFNPPSDGTELKAFISDFRKKWAKRNEQKLDDIV